MDSELFMMSLRYNFHFSSYELFGEQNFVDLTLKLSTVYCGLCLFGNYYPSTGEFQGKFKNLREIKGSKELVKQMSKILDKEIEGSFEVKLKEEFE